MQKGSKINNQLVKIIFVAMAFGVFALADLKVFPAVATITISDSDETDAERCSRLQGNIDDRLDFFEGRRDKHMDMYNDMKSKLETIEEKLKDAGYDTTDFKTEVDIFSKKIKNFSEDYNDFFEKLTDVRDYVCDHTDSESKDELKDARTKLETVQEDSDDIRSYYLNTIRPDVGRFKNQAPSN